jgi:hypothetical protein
MTILGDGALTGSDDDILIASLFNSAFCLASSPLLFESVDEGGPSVPLIRRRRKTIEGLFEEYGERHFERAYRMSFASFCHLHSLLHDSLLSSDKPYHKGGLPRISTYIRLAAAIRYFGGGSVWDIMISHGMSRTETYESVWKVVDAVNTLLPTIVYPTCKEEQSKIAGGFVRRSECSFDNCAGCIDGMLLWIDQPTPDSCRDAGVGAKKFFCGRKHKFGLNLQAVCDSDRRFIDLSILNPGSASDFLSFITSELYRSFASTSDFLKAGLTIYGDNAYINNHFMTVPFSNAVGVKDDFNFYHSQVRMNIECTFGIFTSRWRLLKSPLSSQLSLSKVVALVFCLAKLHNFCIDQRLKESPTTTSNTASTIPIVPERHHHDTLTVFDSDNPEDPPQDLLHGGAHFDDVDGGRRGAGFHINSTTSQATDPLIPRDLMLEIISVGGWDRQIRRPKRRRNHNTIS